MSTLAILNARLLDAASDYDGPSSTNTAPGPS